MYLTHVAPELSWTDLDPSQRPLVDTEQLRAVVRGSLRSAVLAAPITDARSTRNTLVKVELEAAIDRAIVTELGAWASGWRWSASEGGDGGPIQTWCCSCSVAFGSDAKLEETVARAVDSLVEWDALLRVLADMFRRLAEDRSDETLSRAATEIQTLVVARTGASDAWYRTLETMLLWYVESRPETRAEDREAARAKINAVMSGRFQSWIASTPEQQAEFATALTDAFRVGVAGNASNLGQPDALAKWRKVRIEHRPHWQPERVPQSSNLDGHTRFIEKRDRTRDADRGERMREALAAARADAAGGEPLTIGRLSTWAELVLGEPARIRTMDAFAHGGHERYGIFGGFRQALAEVLTQATDASVPVIRRAARVYLDIAFFHPFEDGNARLARLALDFVLSREGLTLLNAEPVFLLTRGVDEGHSLMRLALVLEHMVARKSSAE